MILTTHRQWNYYKKYCFHKWNTSVKVWPISGASHRLFTSKRTPQCLTYIYLEVRFFPSANGPAICKSPASERNPSHSARYFTLALSPPQCPIETAEVSQHVCFCSFHLVLKDLSFSKHSYGFIQKLGI